MVLEADHVLHTDVSQRPGRGAKYCNQHVCLSVCMLFCLSVSLSVRSHISKTTRLKFTKFSVHITRDNGSVFPLTAVRYVMYFRFRG